MAVGDEVAGQVDRDRVECARERERGLVVGGDLRGQVGVAGEPIGVEGDRGGERELFLGDELPISVQRGPAG